MTMQGDLALKHANGMSFADVLALHAHLLAEQIRQGYSQPRWEGDEPEYAYGYNAGTHDSADKIDPEVSE